MTAPRYPWLETLPTAPGWYVFQYDAALCTPGTPSPGVCLQLDAVDGILYVHPDDDAGDWTPVADLFPGRWKGPLDLETL